MEDELTRRRFMAGAVVTMSGIVGIGLAIPTLGGMLPSQKGTNETWSPLTAREFDELRAATQTPVRLTFSSSIGDAYLPEEKLEDYVWGVKVDPRRFREARPDLFDSAAEAGVPYPAINLGFVIFSPLCPHLGGRYNWIVSERIFRCPLHFSTFDFDGAHLGGPAPRGLDPLPMREYNGVAQIIWIRYKTTTPDRIVVSYQL